MPLRPCLRSHRDYQKIFCISSSKERLFGSCRQLEIMRMMKEWSNTCCSRLQTVFKVQTEDENNFLISLRIRPVHQIGNQQKWEITQMTTLKLYSPSIYCSVCHVKTPAVKVCDQSQNNISRPRSAEIVWKVSPWYFINVFYQSSVERRWRWSIPVFIISKVYRPVGPVCATAEPTICINSQELSLLELVDWVYLVCQVLSTKCIGVAGVKYIQC